MCVECRTASGLIVLSAVCWWERSVRQCGLGDGNEPETHRRMTSGFGKGRIMAVRVTLKDVAAAAGVSPATVSLVLNGRPVRISEERRERVLQVAASMHYRANQAARSLVTRRSNMVGLVVPDIENMFFSSLFKTLEDVAIRDGYSLIVVNSDDSREREHALITGVAARGVDGLFLVPALESCADGEALRRDVEECPCPVVFVDRLVDAGYCDGVGVDNEEGGRLAAEALLASLGMDADGKPISRSARTGEAGGVRPGRIGCVCVERPDGMADHRLHGFVEALERAGVTLDDDCVAMGDYRYSSGYDAADRLLDAGVTAVFCANDLMAMGLRKRVEERGLRVPEDVSIVGYDDILARFGLSNDLTTISQNVDALATECWAVLKRRFADPHAPLHVSMITPHLVSRSTVR